MNSERKREYAEGNEEKFVIAHIKRDKDFEYTAGIRAHPFMDWQKCLWSILVPWHNEFLNIWFYLVFSIYFWVQLGFIAAQNKKYYKFDHAKEYHFMFIATLGIALSLTMTCAFLIFYSIS